MKIIDLIGQRFGKLTVIKQVPKPEDKKQNGIYWLCECDCGNTCVRFGSDLKKARKYNKECRCENCNIEDITGMKFNKLTVLRRSENYILPNGKTQPVWECMCDCQLKLPENERKTCFVRGQYLKNGHTKSCGCIQNHKNEYDLTGEYGIGYTTNFDLYNRNEFYFDLEDYDKIKDYCWYFDKNDGYLYSSDGVYENGKTTIKMHRIILNLTKEDSNLVADHIHGKETRNDNRKSNLRIATYSQNGMNSGTQSNNTTGVTGIGYYDGLWLSRIGIDNKSIFLGVFNNKEEAIKARKEAEEKYFGEYSYDNSQTM